MLPFFWYMLKVIICSGILLGYYWLFLRNKLFHQYNRFYLLSALLLSLLLPLLKIGVWQQDTQSGQIIRALQAVSAGDEYMSNVTVTAQTSNWSMQDIYSLLYWSVSILFFLVMLRALFLIRTLLKRYPVQLIDEVSFVNTNNSNTPFSFLKFIFWNSNIDIDTSTGRQIFRHEVAHIREKHTYDKLLVNGILVFCWCNPFFWLYKKELNMIHEFIADKKAVEDSDTAAFAAMILQAAYPGRHFDLTNHFFYSPIKRRLLMLTKNKNPKVNYAGRVMALPMFILIFAAFAFKTKSARAESDFIPPQQTGIIPASYNTQVDTLPTGFFVNVKNTDSVYLKSANFKNRALVILDSKEIGNVGNEYVEKNDGKFSSIVIYSPDQAVKTFGEKGRYGVIKLTREEAVFLSADSAIFNGQDQSLRLSGSNTKIDGNLANTLIYIDGRIATYEELKNIPPAKISHINVLKGDKLDDIAEAKGKSAILQVSLKPEPLAEVVVTGKVQKQEAPVAIALDKMNVLYIGVDNPVTIAVPNVPADKVFVTIDNGTITGSNGKYLATVTQPGTTTIRVGTIKNDRKELLTEQVFRVKMMPDPVNGKLPADYDTKFSTDSSKFFKLNEEYKQLKLQQAKATLAEKTVAGQQLQANQKLLTERKLYNEQVLKEKQQLVLQQHKNAKLNEKLVELKAQAVENNKQQILYEQKLKEIDASKLKQEVLLQNTMPDKIFVKAETSPKFIGGEEAWKMYLMKNVKANIPVEEGWKAGIYKVIVRFIVHADGKISDVQTENYKGSKTALHCISIIKNAAGWAPALQNGKKVNAYHRQPITFVIEE
jgi:hypothetical protein